MGTFGVSSNIGACSSHIYSNPITIAAIKRQQQRELERSPEYQAMLQAKADREREKAKAEERWCREFNHAITNLREQHHSKAAQNTSDILAMFKTIDVMPVQEQPAPIVTGRLTAECIIRAGVHGTPFTVGDIKGHRRTRKLIELRHKLIAKVYVECPWLSLPQIGKAFGGRDHSSAWHAVKRMGVHHTQTGVLR